MARTRGSRRGITRQVSRRGQRGTDSVDSRMETQSIARLQQASKKGKQVLPLVGGGGGGGGGTEHLGLRTKQNQLNPEQLPLGPWEDPGEGNTHSANGRTTWIVKKRPAYK